MAAKLSINSKTAALVEVRNADSRLMDRGISPRELNQLQEGNYVISATSADGSVTHRVVTVGEDKNYRVDLSSTASEAAPADVPDTFYARFLNLLKEKAGVAELAPSFMLDQSALNESASFRSDPVRFVDVDPDYKSPDIFVRLFQLEDWGRAASVPKKQIPAMSGKFEPDSAKVDFHLTGRRVFFAQVAAPGLVPINVAIPGAGRLKSTDCSLRVYTSIGQMAVRVEFESRPANLCIRYLERGDFESARQLAHQTLPGGANSFLKEMGSWFSARLNDPTASILSRYIALRVGDLDYTGNLPFLFFSDIFDWMSDGAIISGEIAARRGHHKEALSLFLIASNLSKHSPPLFTEGFKFLVSRLKQYSRSAQSYGIEETEAKQAEEFLDKLDPYAGYIEVDPITLTFSGADLSNLEDSQHPVEFDSPDWFKIEHP